MKLTSLFLVISTKTFSTFTNPSIEKCELTEAPTKNICNKVVPVLRFKDTATLYPPRRSEYLLKRTHLFGRQSARFPQTF